MPITLPTAPSTANVDSSADDPKLARADILAALQAIGTLLGQINSLGITQPGDGIEIVTAAAGTRDGAAVKLDGGSLTRSAAGLRVSSKGVTLAMIADNGAANGNIIVYDSALNSGAGGWKVAAPASSGNQKRKAAVFTTVGNSTWSVPAGVTEAKVTVVGGGGNGGNVVAGFNQAGGGGGGGGTAIKWVTGLTPGASVNVTVGGVNGTSLFGPSGAPLARATGGGDGQGNSAFAAGGAGGIGNVGDVLIGGSGGGAAAGPSLSGHGGSSTHGGGASSIALSGGASNGLGGTGYGAGGSGAAGYGTLNRGGGAGTAGIVIVEWIEA